MKKRFTGILAAFALLVGLTIPMGVWGQAPVNTVLWGETWTDGTTGETPSQYGFEGTTVYGGATLTYSQDDDGTKLYNEKLAGGTAPELLLKSGNKTWTISDIPAGQATGMSLTFKSNKTTFAVTSTTEGITISGSQKSWTIEATSSVSSFNLTIKNTGSSNARIDDVELIVTTAGGGAADDPVISFDPSIINLGNSNLIGTLITRTFTVSQANLDEDITLSVNNGNLSTNSIEQGADPTVVTWTYTPTAAGAINAIVTAASGETEETLEISGAAVAPVSGYTIDFESVATLYTDWTFTNMTSHVTGDITAHGGTYYGTTGGKTTASVKTSTAIAAPGTLTCFVSKASNNSNDATWYIQVSEDGNTWENVGSQNAASMDKGVWIEFTANLSGYSNVYVRVYYDGNTAIRTIDDLSLTMNNNPAIAADDVEIAYDATNGSIAYTINNGVEGGAVTSAEVTASNPENWLTVNGSNPYASPISLSCAANATATEKTATVTLTYTYNRETVTETVNVTQAANPNATMTIAEVRALSTGTTVATKGVVTSISVSGSNKTAYFQDNTAGIVAFGPFTTEVAVGDEIRVEGELTVYHGLLEIGKNNAAPTVTVLSQNNTVTPVLKTIAEISNSIQAQLVKVEDATVTVIDGQNTTIAQGQNTIVVRGISGVEYAVNDVLTLTANVGCYDNPQLVNPQNVEVQHNTTPVINANNPEALAYDATSGSIAYTIDNPVDGVSLGATTDANWISNITVGDESVTFTTTVNEGSEDRTATFILTYEGAVDKEITVTQGHPVVDYATLPFTWDDAATPTGVTSENVGRYTSSPRLKFNNNTGEGYVILKVNETPGAIVFDIKANPGSGTTSTGIFSVMTSNDGTDYNTLVTYNSIINQKQTLCITNISADTRYIKWSYDKTTSTSGNVAVGNIIVTKAVEIANNTTWTAGTNTPQDNYTYVVNDGATLTLNGDYSIYFDKPYYLVVKDGGQLVAAIPGQGTMQKNIAACDYNDQNNAGYNLIASPVSTNLTATNVVGLLTNEYDLYKFDNTAELEWINYKAEEFTAIEPKVGYLYASGSNTVVEFAGALNGYEELYEVTIPNVGFNLIGNPFACDVYVYDESSDAMNFQVLNGAGQEFTDGSTIKAGEAFLVQTTKNNQKLYFNHEQISKASAVTMNVEKNRGSVIDNVRVRFGEGHGMNKFYLNENGTHIFIPQGNEEMAVAYSAAEAEMPVSFRASENGTYTLAVEAENVEMNYLHLIDNLTGMDVDLLQTPSYTFEAKTSDYASRFRLVFKANGTNENNAETFAYFNGTNWTVSNVGDATLQVVDVTGRTVANQMINGNAELNLNQPAGVYVIRLVNGDNVKTQKVVVR